MALLRRSPTLLKPLYTSSIRLPLSTAAITVESITPFETHMCDLPSRTTETNPNELMSYFRDLATMRRMEIASDSLYKSKLIRDFCHLYDVQEAVAIGMEVAITKQDCIITAYRGHCIFLTRDRTLVEAFAELMGREP